MRPPPHLLPLESRWRDTLTSAQPFIRPTRSFPQRSHSYFGDGHARVLRSLRVAVRGQLRNLDDVKKALAEEARAAGGNSVVEYKYGQKQKGFWSTSFSLDGVDWYGEGKAAVLPPNALRIPE